MTTTRLLPFESGASMGVMMPFALHEAAEHRPSIGHAGLILAGAAAGFAGLHALAHGAAV
jgi:hypothetical protein